MGSVDPDTIGVILGPILGIPAFIVVTVLILRYKLKKKELGIQGGNPELGAEVDALRDDLDDTRAQLAQMQERLDFAERLLAAGRKSQEDTSG